MIDKSIRPDYVMQGKVKNYLGKQKMVKAPKKWKSAPNHPDTELAYITKAEKDALVKMNLHGSMNGKAHKGPSGIISLNGWGDASHGFGGSGNTGGNTGSGGEGNPHRDPPPAPAPAPAPSPHRDPTPTRAPDFVTGGPKTPTAPVDFDDYNYPGIDKPKIDTGPKKDILPEFKKRKTTTITGGNPFLEGPYEKKIVYEPREGPARTYDPRTDPNALLDRGSGIGGLLKGLGTAAAGVFLPMLLPAKAAAAYKMYNTAKTASAFAKKFGVTDTDVVQSLTKNVLNKDILKQTRKDDIPKVADRHPGTGKKKRTTTDDRGDGVNTILPETLQSTVSEGTQQFLSDEQKEQYLVAQNKMKAALAEGYYLDSNGKRIALDDEQINALTQFITKIESLLVDPVMMADGGRVDKAFGGRVRDI